MQANGNADIADNDYCTKLLITNEYWGIIQPDISAILRIGSLILAVVYF